MNWEELFLELQQQKILYVLGLLAVAMTLDFFSGVYVAKKQQCLSSKVGINGILRKLASMVLLVFFLPVALLLPIKTGIAMLYVFYVGYLLLEIQSILENYQKIGINSLPFSAFLELLKKYRQK
ncbi:MULTISPECIES: phage holin family protein [Enterococcus]|uniref:phage holin family protein n=1 Tax=Enterococcus TaxID=1350 RepID=UPI00065E39DB|nr:MULTISPECIES: phage holin family protein [Enterococcus]KAF1300096.1 holin [Enterococcus sp. JM9B]